MLKTVSSITNAIGALNFKGTWNASTNTPTIVSGVGVKGDYFVVSVAGSTTIDGISNWGVGDWITYNGTVWQRVEGGADLNGVNLSASGTTTLNTLNTSGQVIFNDAGANVDFRVEGDSDANLLFVDASTDRIGVKNNTPAVEFDVVGQVRASTGILFGTDTAAANALDDYEEGTWTPTFSFSGGNGTASFTVLNANYTKIGNFVTVNLFFGFSKGTASGDFTITNLPFSTLGSTRVPCAVLWDGGGAASNVVVAEAYVSTVLFYLLPQSTSFASQMTAAAMNADPFPRFSVTYQVA